MKRNLFMKSFNRFLIKLIIYQVFIGGFLYYAFAQSNIPQGISGEIFYEKNEFSDSSIAKILDLEIPDQIYPTNNATDVPIIPKFIHGTIPQANRYELQVSFNQNFSNIISYSYWQFAAPLTINYLEWFPGITDIENFTNNTIYYWRVRAIATNTNEESPWSQPFKYTTKSPGGTVNRPTLVNPANNSIVPWIDITFQWNQVSTANWYQVQWSTSSTFSGFSFQWSNMENPTHITNIKPVTNYYWRVIAFNDNSISPFSLNGNFSTGNQVTLIQNEYTFDDGSGLDNYANSLELYWLIQPTNSENITLTFLSFDTESDYDFVTIYDGPNTNSQILGNFSGNQIPPSVTSSDGIMLVKFKTDGSITKSGWTANYLAGNKTPIIFIPGIMGSPLYNDINNDNHLTSNERMWIRLAFLNDLSPLQLDTLGVNPYDEEYNVKVSPIRGDNVRTIYQELDPGPWPHISNLPLSKYSGLINELENLQNGYKIDDYDYNHDEEENLFVFTYDWRKSNDYNAQVLADFIDSVLNWNSSNQVNIISHSMGGIVAKAGINFLGNNKNKIKKIIFIGTPHLGASKTLWSALTGNLMITLQNLLISTYSHIRHISKNFPSLYELFPFPPYYDISYNNGVSAKKELYSNTFYNINSSLSYDEVEEFFKNVMLFPSNHSFNDYLIDNAADLHSDLALVDFGDIEVYNIIGFNEPTMGRVYYFPFLTKYLTNLNGDGTVPLRSAELINNNINTANNSYYIKSFYGNYDHLSLPSCAPVLEIIGGLLKEPTFTGPFNNINIFTNPPESYGAPNSLQFIVGSPVALHAYDENGRHTGPLTDSTWENNIPGSIYIPGELNDTLSKKGIVLPKEGSYTILIYSLGYQSSFNFYADEIVDGDNTISAVFENVPVFTNTLATCSLESSITPNISLMLDYDNDGTIDTVINPTIVTDLKDNVINKLPSNYYLGQNYPNPFNPSTVINWQLPVSSFVTLKIYDILGREVVTLVNEEKPAGNYEVEFNAANLPSGVYFYQLQAGDYVNTKKMILIK